MQTEEQFHNINGNSLRFKLIYSGNGEYRPTLVFLHDALGSIEGWKDFPVRLCEKLQLNGLVYERAGHGQSDPLNEDYSVDYMKDAALRDLSKVLEWYGIQNPVFIGHSDGGTIALIYESYMDHAVALVSIAGHIKVEEITREGIREAVKDFKDKGLFKRLERYHGDKTALLLNRWEKIWLSEEFGQWNIGSELENIKCPVLLIQGEEDEYATLEHIEEIKNSIGDNAHMKIMRNVRHFPHREAPELLIKDINQFIINKILLQ